MADLFPKWIIEDGEIILGVVTQHQQLSNYDLSVDDKRKHIIGGGWYHWDCETGFLFYSCSSDFGGCTFDQVREAWLKNNDYPNVRFSRHIKLEDAIKDNILLTR